MKLSDLKPRRASFKLSATKKEYFLRPLTPNDAVIIEKNVGDLRGALNSGKISDLFKIAYLQLEPECTMDFKKKQVKFVDMSGNYKTEEIGGHLLFISLIANLEEQFDVIKACLVSMGVPDESIKELMEKKDEAVSIEIENKENDKKKVKKKLKK